VPKVLCRRCPLLEGGVATQGSPAQSQLASSPAFVDGAKQRHTEANVFLAEPDGDTTGLKQIVQLLGGPLPVVPRMAEEDVTKVRLICQVFDLVKIILTKN
jgi:hypothetical protein